MLRKIRPGFIILLTGLLLVAASETIGTEKNQDTSEVITIDVYDLLIGETKPVEVSAEEIKEFLAGETDSATSLFDYAVAVWGRELEFESKLDRLGFINNEMIRIVKSVKLEPDLLYPEGPVLTLGVNFKGYFSVTLLEGEYDSSVLDRVYAAFEEQFLRESLYDPPVFFVETKDADLIEDWRRQSPSRGFLARLIALVQSFFSWFSGLLWNYAQKLFT